MSHHVSGAWLDWGNSAMKKSEIDIFFFHGAYRLAKKTDIDQIIEPIII